MPTIYAKSYGDAARNTLQGSQQLPRCSSSSQGLPPTEWRPRCTIENHPRYKDAVAARDEARRQLAHTVVSAPLRHCDQRAVASIANILPHATAFNIVSTDRVWVQASPKETELTTSNLDRRRRRDRQLARPTMERHCRQHQPGVCVELFAAAGGKYQRQLGQGGAADTDAGQRHQYARQASIARGNERRAKRRDRT